MACVSDVIQLASKRQGGPADPALHLARHVGDEQVAAVGQLLARLTRVQKVVQRPQLVRLQEPVCDTPGAYCQYAVTLGGSSCCSQSLEAWGWDGPEAWLTNHGAHASHHALTCTCGCAAVRWACGSEQPPCQALLLRVLTAVLLPCLPESVHGGPQPARTMQMSTDHTRSQR